MRILAFIPAREKSTRFPGKNLAPFLGQSLLRRAVGVALEAKALGVVDAVVVSVDNAAMESEARVAGALAHWRSQAVRRDNATVADVLRDWLMNPQASIGGVRELQRTDWDAVCVLLPTSPLRTVADVVKSRLLFEAGKAEVCMSVIRWRHNPWWALTLDSDGFLTPQWGIEPASRPSMATLRRHCGCVLWALPQVVVPEGDFYGRPVLAYEHDGCVDVDTPEDLSYAEFLCSGKGDR